MGTGPPSLLAGRRQNYETQIKSLFASGGTALCDAIDAAFQVEMASRKNSSDQITAIVLLTDGADSDNKIKLNALLERIKSNDETRNVRVIANGYADNNAKNDVLEKIAKATQGKFYHWQNP